MEKKFNRGKEILVEKLDLPKDVLLDLPKIIVIEMSSDGESFHAVGQETEAAAMPSGWVGVKVGLAALHEGEGECGCGKAEYFVFQELE